jgi:hypothetical protein
MKLMEMRVSSPIRAVGLMLIPTSLCRLYFRFSFLCPLTGSLKNLLGVYTTSCTEIIIFSEQQRCMYFFTPRSKRPLISRMGVASMSGSTIFSWQPYELCHRNSHWSHEFGIVFSPEWIRWYISSVISSHTWTNSFWPVQYCSIRSFSWSAWEKTFGNVAEYPNVSRSKEPDRHGN